MLQIYGCHSTKSYQLFHQFNLHDMIVFYISRRAATIKLLAVLYFGTDMGRNLIGFIVLSESYISYD